MWYVLWIICGVLAYGLVKDDTRRFFLRWNRLLENIGGKKSTFMRYEFRHELSCIFFGALGFIGLGVVLILITPIAIYRREMPSLCYRMPKKLCKRS